MASLLEHEGGGAADEAAGAGGEHDHHVRLRASGRRARLPRGCHVQRHVRVLRISIEHDLKVRHMPRAQLCSLRAVRMICRGRARSAENDKPDELSSLLVARLSEPGDWEVVSVEALRELRRAS